MSIPVIITVLSFILGFFTINSFNADTNIVSDNIGKEDVSTLLILKNNLLVVLSLLSGAFLFGITTIINLTLNGMVLGAQIGSAVNNGVNPKLLLLLIAPHGILEIPGIWLAGAAGLKIPYEFLRYLLNKKSQILDKKDVLLVLGLIILSITLIVIAAIIEGDITEGIASRIVA